jgi:membrane protease YdiL (CAAX protease family)
LTSSESWRQRLIAGAAAAVAVSLLLYFPDRDDGSGAIVGGLCALVAVPFALAALAKCRALPARSIAEHVRLVPVTLALGIGLGLANLTVNYGMAAADPVIREQMITRWARFSPWSIVVSGPIMEEIAYRLVLLSSLAWIVALFTDNRRTGFYVALGVSSSIFGVAHIFYGGVDHPAYAVGMTVKSAAAGLLLGWVFWRRGLPHSIACHSAANGIHLLLMPFVFQG